MHTSLLALAFSSLAFVCGTRAQVVTASVFLPVFDTPDSPLQGEIIGTGADGTTYVLSNIVTNTGDTPYTLTLVQDLTHVSMALFASSAPDGSIALSADCSVDANTDAQAEPVVACSIVEEAIFDGVTTTSATTGSEALPLIPVLVSTREAGASATDATGSGPTTTAGSSSVTASASATTARSVSASSSSQTASSSGASRVTIVTGLGTALFSFLMVVLLNSA